jgi:hypothetical protein
MYDVTLLLKETAWPQCISKNTGRRKKQMLYITGVHDESRKRGGGKQGPHRLAHTAVGWSIKLLLFIVLRLCADGERRLTQ